MKKWTTRIFVSLGVIFLTLIVFALYFYITDPLNLKPMFLETEEIGVEEDGVEGSVTVDKNPILNDKQEKALETFGVDPAKVPSSITPEQEACFESILGSERVSEIKAGDTPTVMEYLKAKDCI